MFVDPFWAGVLATIVAEIMLFILSGVIHTIKIVKKERKFHDDED